MKQAASTWLRGGSAGCWWVGWFLAGGELSVDIKSQGKPAADVIGACNSDWDSRLAGVRAGHEGSGEPGAIGSIRKPSDGQADFIRGRHYKPVTGGAASPLGRRYLAPGCRYPRSEEPT